MSETTLLRGARGLLWTVAVVGTLAIVASSLSYFLPGFIHPFVAERPELATSHLWRASLVVHVGAGMLVLPAGLFLLSQRALARWRPLHVLLGRGYVALLVLLLMPTGMHLAWHAKGGLAAGVGFALSNAMATGSALYAVRLAAQGERASHRDWMLRSFAQVGSAISFRIFHLMLQLLETPYEATYVASLWLSVLGNALLAELVLHMARRRDGEGRPDPSLERQRSNERRSDAPSKLAPARVSAPDRALHPVGQR